MPNKEDTMMDAMALEAMRREVAKLQETADQVQQGLRRIASSLGNLRMSGQVTERPQADIPCMRWKEVSQGDRGKQFSHPHLWHESWCAVDGIGLYVLQVSLTRQTCKVLFRREGRLLVETIYEPGSCSISTAKARARRHMKSVIQGG